MRRLQLTLESLRKYPRDKRQIILVDWCPTDAFLYETAGDITDVEIITVLPEFGERLNKQGGKNITFFEYVAKQTGFYSAMGEIVVFMNPDIVMSVEEIDKAIEFCRSGGLSRAVRFDLRREVARLGSDQILEGIKNKSIVPFRSFETAAGDFIALKRSSFIATGGFRMCHGNWDCDNEFVRRAASLGMPVRHVCDQYHIDHDFSAMPDTHKGRPCGDALNHKEIDQDILDDLNKYCVISSPRH